jgi:hypothetical protein
MRNFQGNLAMTREINNRHNFSFELLISGLIVSIQKVALDTVNWGISEKYEADE